MCELRHARHVLKHALLSFDFRRQPGANVWSLLSLIRDMDLVSILRYVKALKSRWCPVAVRLRQSQSHALQHAWSNFLATLQALVDCHMCAHGARDRAHVGTCVSRMHPDDTCRHRVWCVVLSLALSVVWFCLLSGRLSCGLSCLVLYLVLSIVLSGVFCRLMCALFLGLCFLVLSCAIQ